MSAKRAAFAIAFLSLAIGLPIQRESADAFPLRVYLGYADNYRAGASFPSPWQGDPNVTFLGGGAPMDSGAIMLYNPAAAPVTVTGVRVDLNYPGTLGGAGVAGQVYTNATVGWPASFDVAPGKYVILAQNACCAVGPGPGFFDTSDYGVSGCGAYLSDTDPRAASVLSFTVAGVATSFVDTGHILTTGGFDLACQKNESLAWRQVGQQNATNDCGQAASYDLSATGGSVTPPPPAKQVANARIVVSNVKSVCAGFPMANVVANLTIHPPYQAPTQITSCVTAYGMCETDVRETTAGAYSTQADVQGIGAATSFVITNGPPAILEVSANPQTVLPGGTQGPVTINTRMLDAYLNGVDATTETIRICPRTATATLKAVTDATGNQLPLDAGMLCSQAEVRTSASGAATWVVPMTSLVVSGTYDVVATGGGLTASTTLTVLQDL